MGCEPAVGWCRDTAVRKPAPGVDVSERQRQLAAALLERHGQTYADELGLDLAQNTPSILFRWLCATILLSARISARIALTSADALARAGWTTADKLAASSWDDRVRVLNRSGYARYDESTARILGATAEMIRDDYGSDLRRLRERAGHDPASERRLLKTFKGIGDVGADIFLREVQSAWTELFLFADKRTLEVARSFGLPDTAQGLADLVERERFPALLAALVRAKLSKETVADIERGP